MNVISARSSYKTIANIEIVYDDQSSKNVEVKLGDIVRINYVILPSKLDTVEGKVIEIDRKTDFLVIDSSEQFKSCVVQLAIENIRDIEVL
jgi:DNA-directed RNA polymerase subunit H (RpoH/RPB5)